MENFVTNGQLEDAFAGADFGSLTPRQVVADTLMKCAAGYDSGRTAIAIMRRLGLVCLRRWKLTEQGEKYLWAVFASLKAENEVLKKQLEEKQHWIDSHI